MLSFCFAEGENKHGTPRLPEGVLTSDQQSVVGFWVSLEYVPDCVPYPYLDSSCCESLHISWCVYSNIVEFVIRKQNNVELILPVLKPRFRSPFMSD